MKLSDARRLALALPQATEQPHFDYTSFRINGKIFATAPPDGQYLHIFVADEDREPALELAPEYLEKLLWGGRVRGLRVRLAGARSAVVADLLRKAWTRKAPKKLVATPRTAS